MAGLFDTLNLGSRSLQTYRQAIDTAGHNLSNVHTPGYTRQRLVIESVTTGSDPLGTAGAGSEATAISRLRNEFLERQIQGEQSNTGSLQAREESLRQALGSLQEIINTRDPSGGSGLSTALNNFFAGLQSLSTDPASIPDRQVFLQEAAALASRFNQIDGRLSDLSASINEQVTASATQANTLLNEIAALNRTIATQETTTGGAANDLRDSRQLKVQELATILKVETSEQENGGLNISVGGKLMVEGPAVSATLESFQDASGNTFLRTSGDTNPLDITGGQVGGLIQARDGEIASLRQKINDLASVLITEVNQVHSIGFSLTGSTGANFFTGTNAADIAVNSALLGNPALFQASGTEGASGDNTVLLALARLGSEPKPALDNQTFSGKHSQTVAWIGQQVANATSSLQDQQNMNAFLSLQRDSVSGVSVDEEMANLVMFQKAFQAAAKLISMTDEMLETIIAM